MSSLPKTPKKRVSFNTDEVEVASYWQFSKPEQGFDSIEKTRPRIDSGIASIVIPGGTIDSDSPDSPDSDDDSDTAAKTVRFKDALNTTLEYYEYSSPSSGFLSITQPGTPTKVQTNRYIGEEIPKVVHFGGEENVIIEFDVDEPERGFTSVKTFKLKLG